MKPKSEIEFMISTLRLKYTEAKYRHNKLDQISMLSGEGSQLREEMNQTIGKITALEWVLEHSSVI